MPRRPRIAPPGAFLHITQRGNYGQPIFADDRDRITFLNLLSDYAREKQVDILAYCLMPNHYHLVARGRTDTSIFRLMQALNGRFAQIMHRRLGRAGRFWQNRYFSCVMDHAHLWNALRYVETNPVRAGLTAHPGDFRWSSGPAHLGRVQPPNWLDDTLVPDSYTSAEWDHFLQAPAVEEELAALRLATQTARPLVGHPIAIAHSA